MALNAIMTVTWAEISEKFKQDLTGWLTKKYKGDKMWELCSICPV